MSPQLRAALVRAVASALLAGVLVALTALQTGSAPWDAVVNGVVAALTILASRGVVEGWLDTTRADAGAMLPSDVGYRQAVAPAADLPPGKV